MESHNYSFFQLFSFSTWEVFLHLMATFKRWFVMTAWAGVAFFKGTSLCQVKWLGLMKMFFWLWLLKPCYASLCGKWAGVYNHVHILTFLIDLQWLPVLLLTYKRMHCVAPSYLIDVLKFYDPVMCLRSKSKSLLSTLKYELEGCGWRAFCVAATIICGILYWIT